MFRNKLKALEHPTPDAIDPDNRTHFESTVLWLEDQKIRLYKIEDREGLRQIGKPAWEPAYKKFKLDVGMPKLATTIEELSWLLIHAVRLEYLDNVDMYKDYTAKYVTELNKSAAPKIASSNPFDRMNMMSSDFEIGVRNLGRKLKISDCHDHLHILDAASRLIYEKIRPDAVKCDPPIGKAYNIKSGEKSAFDDKNMDEAAKILRLLQIQNIRQLQTSINETIVSVQEITADPRTDTKLGKVGF